MASRVLPSPPRLASWLTLTDATSNDGAACELAAATRSECSGEDDFTHDHSSMSEKVLAGDFVTAIVERREIGVNYRPRWGSGTGMEGLLQTRADRLRQIGCKIKSIKAKWGRPNVPDP